MNGMVFKIYKLSADLLISAVSWNGKHETFLHHSENNNTKTNKTKNAAISTGVALVFARDMLSIVIWNDI